MPEKARVILARFGYGTPMPTIEQLRRDAAGCTRCDLYLTGTQVVFGEGSPKAGVVLVGEQPGDQEDRAGRPFVGPAGKLLDRALAEAGIDRSQVYVTNAVKHFKWVARGKRRIHQKPNAAEIAACRLWLDGELAALEPRVLVALGATAAQALYGRSFRVTKSRGVPVETPLAPLAFATIHPSAVLRAEDREGEFQGLVDDLKVVAKHL